MPWRDCAALLDDAADRDTQAARDAENLAMLVDREDFWLHSEYAQWITDPDDPEVKAEQARRRKYGIKSPPVPLMRPVAHRPRELAAVMLERYLAELAKQDTPIHRDPDRKLSAREAAKLLGWSG